MRKLILLAFGVAALGLALGACDAGDPYIPGEASTSATIRATDLVGDWDNLHLMGELTDEAPVAMTRDGLSWSATIAGLQPGSHGYGIYTEDGAGKALQPVVEDLVLTVSSDYNVGGDLQVTIEPAAGTGFNLVVYNNNPAYDNIKIKGEMNGWANEITGSNAAGTVFFLHVEAGLEADSYEWGVIEDDGSEFGIWLLPPGPNLQFAVDGEGLVSGETTFTIASPQPTTTLTLNCDMNDFEGNFSTVSVRGTFNGWADAPTQMADDNEDGIYTVVLDVEQNEAVIFKFITDGANYENVPSDCGVDDGYGGFNRSVDVGADPVSFTAPFGGCPAVR